jgi:ribosomal silencing factor RsfS
VDCGSSPAHAKKKKKKTSKDFIKNKRGFMVVHVCNPTFSQVFNLGGLWENKLEKI